MGRQAPGHGLVLDPAVLSGFEAAVVQPGKRAGDLIWKKGIVARRDEELGDAPDVLLRGHPTLAVKALEVHRPGVGAQRALAAQVVVVIEVTERQLAQCTVDGRAEAQPREV